MGSSSFFELISFTGFAIETVGVLIIILGVGNATLRYIRNSWSHQGADNYHKFRREMGRAMLVGLDFLVAGDIIRTVIVIGSTMDLLSLALVVAIRTVLVFTIHLEVEGRWPWQLESRQESKDQ